MKKIRIANGAGYAGDRLDAGEVLIERGNIDYLTFECLAERTIGLCQRDKMHDPNLGYSRLSEERLRRTLKLAKEHGVKIISNLGAANPEAAIRLIQKICREQEIVGLKLAAVTGDNIFDKVEKYYDYNVLEFNGKLGDIREKLISGNAYCGVEGIVEALKNGADVVITGRVADPALTLAPLCYEYGWTLEMKAVKNETEISNTRKAHVKDAVAMCKFMYWLKKNVGKIPMTEISASDYLESLRREQEGLLDLSFDTICGYADHGAIVHYAATPESDVPLKPEGLLLVDSGGHYLEGTTDITRTFALAETF